MKIKRIISLICVFMLSASCCAHAAALRKDFKTEKSTSGKRDNDILYLDFSSGDIPAEMSVGSTVYIDTYETGYKTKKNCLVVNDTSHDTTYNGVSANIATGELTGLVGVEIRYMYDYDETKSSKFLSFIMGLYDKSGKMLSRSVVASANGSTQFNYGGTSSAAAETKTMDQNTWYTVKWVLNFDDATMNYTLKNEGSGVTGTVTGASYYENGCDNNLGKISLQSSMYGGKMVFDYVRVSRETLKEEEDDPNADAGKGVESEKISAPANTKLDGKINICIDGTYKYTTADPYEKDGKLMVSAKNLASFWNLGYVKSDDKCFINTEGRIISISPDGVSLESAAISSAYEEKDGQIFISAEDFAAALGCESTYDSDNMTLNITTVSDENAEGGEAVEK